MRFSIRLLPSRSGDIAICLLNNPKPLHALTLDMIDCLHDVLTEYYKDDTIKAILFKSSKDTKVPAFCAGGDVKQIVLEAKGKSDEKHGQGIQGLGTADFFRHEYTINYMLATAKIPQISLWDGIVMGGGAGISVHGKYRIATENTVFAMPETNIGLFPDVGSTYWMPRILSPSVAVYLALTGARLGPAECLTTGLATHYVPSEKLDALEQALVHETQPVDKILDSFNQPLEQQASCRLTQHHAEIDQAFGILDNESKGVEDIVATLKGLDTEFSAECVQLLEKMSPTSMKVTLEALRRGAKVDSIGEALRMEYRISQGFMREGSDFYEGIRAALIDKDGKPQWNPSRLEDVTKDMVESYFVPLEHEWEIPQSKL